MTLNNWTPSNTDLKKFKIMESPELLDILKKMEGGAVIWKTEFGALYLKEISSHTHLPIRQFRTLFNAGLIAPERFDDYIEYRLTYKGAFSELVKGVKE